MPAVEGDQAVDQPVQGRAVEMVVIGRAGGERLGLRQHVGEGIGVVAPALAEHVGEQGVADDALGEGIVDAVMYTAPPFIPYFEEQIIKTINRQF